MDDLVYRETVLQQLEPVTRRRRADLGQRRAAARRAGYLTAACRVVHPLYAQRLDELLEEQRYAMRQLPVGRLGRQPLRNLERAAFDQLGAVRGEKFV